MQDQIKNLVAMGYRKLPDRWMWAKPVGYALLTWHDENLLCLRGTRNVAPVIFDSARCGAESLDELAKAETALHVSGAKNLAPICAFLTDSDRLALIENSVEEEDDWGQVSDNAFQEVLSEGVES